MEWFSRLRDATDAERQDWRVIGNGIGVHWPKVDEDISVTTLMRGIDKKYFNQNLSEGEDNMR